MGRGSHHRCGVCEIRWEGGRWLAWCLGRILVQTLHARGVFVGCFLWGLFGGLVALWRDVVGVLGVEVRSSFWLLLRSGLDREDAFQSLLLIGKDVLMSKLSKASLMP